MPGLGKMQEGIFVRRPNRFLAEIELPGDGPVWAHLPNSGRLKELLLPGAAVWIRPVSGVKRRTSYDLVLVEHNITAGSIYVCVDTRLPGAIFTEGLGLGFPSLMKGLTLERAEVRFLRSRIDFLLTASPGQETLVEVKSVTLVENGEARFPDAPTLRGSRHLEDLMQAPALGYEAAVIFIVQRSDAVSFVPNDAMDSLFGARLRQAVKRGVQVFAYSCQVTTGEITPLREIPALF